MLKSLELPSTTSVGVDRISYRLLREPGPGVVGLLISLFDKSNITLGCVPGEWKTAVVIPVF